MAADLDTFNPFDPNTMQCPFPHYEQMRDERPVMFIESLNVYLVTRHDLVIGILRSPERYSSQFGGTGMPMPREEREAISAVSVDPTGWAKFDYVKMHHAADRLVDRQRAYRVRH